MVWSGNFAMLWIDNYHCSLGTSNLTFWGEMTEPEHLFFSKQKSDNWHENNLNRENFLLKSTGSYYLFSASFIAWRQQLPSTPTPVPPKPLWKLKWSFPFKEVARWFGEWLFTRDTHSRPMPFYIIVPQWRNWCLFILSHS